MEARGVVKIFPGVVANDGVDVEIHRGEVLTILGENGAGKSTIAAVMSGLYQPDGGELYVAGRPVVLNGPRHGLALGIGMVHQHFKLVERFTVAENVVLGDRSQPQVLSMRRVEEAVKALGERFGLPVAPRARVADLSLGERQRVEIVKTLYRGAEILLLDEPTAVLTPNEVEALFATVKAMTAAGKAVVFISHKLGEVMDVSDRVTVMRAGRVTGNVRTADTNRAELARLMVGREVDLTPRRGAAVLPDERLRLSCLSLESEGRFLLHDIDLTVHGGEILGVAGVAGNGQRELAEVMAGLRPPTSGRVEVAGADITGLGPRAARAAGLVYVPEDRLGTGLSPSLTIAENLLLTRPRGLFVSRRKAEAEARRLIDRFEIKAPGPASPTRVLSGGNAQKVLLARELVGAEGSVTRRVLVAASPTRGLDVGAIEAVRALLDGFRAEGAAVVLISEDLEEVMSLSDRIVVLYGGRLTYEAPGESARLDRLGMAMAGIA